jgi:hypothetical protein
MIPAERQVLLRQAIQRWFDAAEIPAGDRLAYECLLAVYGTKSISIRILKPEYHLSPVPLDITELVKFFRRWAQSSLRAPSPADDLESSRTWGVSLRRFGRLGRLCDPLVDID